MALNDYDNLGAFGDAPKQNTSKENKKDSSETGDYQFSYNAKQNEFYVLRHGKVYSKIEIKTIKGIDGRNGVDGLSAFEIWKDHHKEFVNPTEEDFLNSLRGEVVHGRNGENGKSAFDLWVEEHSEIKNPTLEDFFNFLKGQDGKSTNGRDGVNGKSAYELWVEEHPEIQNPTLEDFFDFLKGEDGKSINGRDGVNGKSAYELWIELNPDIANPTIRDFFNSLKGKDGQNGESAFDIWKKVYNRPNASESDFIESLVGTAGKDGASAFDIWCQLQPEGRSYTKSEFLKWIASQVETQQGIPGTTFVPHIEGGELFFENSTTGEKTPRYEIKGKDGTIFYPHIDGYELFFTKDKEGKSAEVMPRVNLRGLDGRTFKPIFDGHSLHFDDGEGHSTQPVDLHGKSAYELWLEEDGNSNKSYDEFKESLRGADGVNVKAKYDFKDLEDYVCPVQKIPTHLLLGTDGLEDNKSAEGILDDRANEIKGMRDAGEKLAQQKGWTLKHLFKEFTWWCAGADRPLLRMCPGDHSKYAGIGTVILFTALMATFSSFIAMQFVLGVSNDELLNWDKMTSYPGNGKYIVSAIFAVFWGLMIFFLDRFITNTMYSDGKVTISWLEFRSALPRIVISILLGIVISAPLELKIFNQEIREQLGKNYVALKLAQYCSDTVYVQKKIDAENQRLINIKDGYKQIPELRKQEAEYQKQAREAANKASSSRINRVAGLEGEALTAALQANAKIESANRENKMRAAQGPKEEAQKIANKIIELSKDTNEIRSIIISYQNELGEIRNRFQNDTCRSSREKYINNAGLFDNLQALHEIAMQTSEVSNNDKIKEEHVKGYRPLNWDGWQQTITGIIVFLLLMSFTFKSYFGTFGDDDEEMAGRTRAWNFITNVPICAIIAVICALCYESFHWLFYYLTTAVGLIMLLFIIIDVSPVFYKMMLADGVYDKKLHEDKKIVEDKIRYNLAKTLYKMDRSELKKIAPFVFSHTYQKMTKRESKPEFFTGPVGNNKEVSDRDEKLFKRVLDQKELIIKAAYDAWFRNMRDAIIGGSQPSGSGNDRTQGENFRPEDNFTQGPSSSFGNDNAKSESEDPNDTNDGDFEETSSHKSENVDNSTSEQESSYSNDENSQYESVVDDDDLNESETPKD